MLKLLIPKVNAWINRLAFVPGDSEDVCLLKRIHWILSLVGVFLVSPLIPVSLILGVSNWTLMGIAYVGFFSVQLIIFYKVRRGVACFGFITQLFHVIFSFVGVLITGGILHSAGIIFIGLVGPLYALVFPSRRRAIILLILYLVSVVAEALLQPVIPPYPPITPVINTVMFLIQFMVVVYAIFFTIQYYTSQMIRMKMLESERLKELDEVKTKIYSNITHEFRTPLTIILGMADQILERPAKMLNEGMYMIKRNGQNLLHLVNQMLDLSKIEAKAMSVNYYQGEMIAYLRYLFHTFNSLAESKNITLEFHTGIDELFMDIDPEKLMQILSNLMSNAVKYTPEGGKIQMAAGTHKTKEKNELIIKVKDNGMGIPAEKIPYIFDRFYKIEDQPSGKSAGTGIGLALTKEMTALLQGTIQVQSDIKNGTEFTITLPVTNNAEFEKDIDPARLKSSMSWMLPEEIPAYAETRGDNEEGDPFPILLIVEDNPDVIRYLESILGAEYRIKTATNGQEGLDIALDCVPDIVISDVMMPGMSGFILCEKLKTDERTSHIPVILLTALAADAKKLEGLETGADDYLVKPFNDTELKVRTRNLIEQRRNLREHFTRNISISPKEITVTSADERFLIRAMDVIEAQLSNPDFGVDIFGKEVGMSHSQLYRKIHALTNLAPVDLIRTIRLRRAASLLQQKFGTISEIAYETGFSSPSYFSDCFRKQFGKSPTEFQTQN